MPTIGDFGLAINSRAIREGVGKHLDSQRTTPGWINLRAGEEYTPFPPIPFPTRNGYNNPKLTLIQIEEHIERGKKAFIVNCQLSIVNCQLFLTRLPLTVSPGMAKMTSSVPKGLHLTRRNPTVPPKCSSPRARNHFRCAATPPNRLHQKSCPTVRDSKAISAPSTASNSSDRNRVWEYLPRSHILLNACGVASR